MLSAYWLFWLAELLLAAVPLKSKRVKLYETKMLAKWAKVMVEVVSLAAAQVQPEQQPRRLGIDNGTNLHVDLVSMR